MNFSNSSWLNYFKIKDNAFIICIVFFLLIISSIIGFQIPSFMTRLYKAYEGDNFYYVLKLGLVLFTVQYIARVLFSVSMGYYIRNLMNSLREDLFSQWIYSQDKVVTKDISYFSQDKYSRGEFQARLINDW